MVDVTALQLAIGEMEPRLALPVEIDEPARVGPLVDEPGARGRDDRPEDLSIVAQLDVELAGIGILVFPSRTGVFHDEARHGTNRPEIHLQERAPALSAPLVGWPPLTLPFTAFSGP